MFGLMRARTCARHTDSWQRWRGQYCGACKTIGARYGHSARFALNHDIVFLTELLSALKPGLNAEPSRAYRSFHCMRLPKQVEIPDILRYSAAATIVLSEFSIIDHIEDTRSRRWRVVARLFSAAFREAERDLIALEFPIKRLRETLASQSKREREGRTLSEFAAATAEATGMFFAHGAAIAGLTRADADALQRLGHCFGELVYLLDAFEDYDQDRVAGAFNAIRAANGLAPSQPLPPEIRAGVIRLLRRLATGMEEQLRCVPLDAEAREGFALRLKLNLDRRLGLCVLPAARSRNPVSRRERWQSALTFARNLSSESPGWRAPVTIAAVALVAYLAPFHSRAASTPSECFSLGFNLMVLGSVFAMADESDSKDHTADGSGGICALMCCSKCITGKWCCCCDDPTCCLGPSEER